MGLFGKSRKDKESEYMSKINVTKCLEENFSLTVDDIYTIIGVGTVVTGTVTSGMCRTGEPAIIGDKETTITMIDIHTKERKPNDAAYSTEHVGLGLRGIPKEQIKIGDIVEVRNAHKYHI
jgi:elongation factor Tu